MMACANAKTLVALVGLAAAAAPALGQAITPPNVAPAGGQWAFPFPYEQVVTDTFNVTRFRLIVNAGEATGGSWQDDMLLELRGPGGATLLIGGDFGTPYPGSVRWDDPSLAPLGTLPASSAGAMMIDATFSFNFGAANGTWSVNFLNNWASGGPIPWNDIQIIPCGPGICPEAGACCLPNGTCQFILDTECATAGGTFAGAGVDCAAANCPVPPGVFAEIGDAGDMPFSAQIVEGSGLVTAILGTVTDPSDVDMYMIDICDPANFRASTWGNITTWDTTLWLFDENGFGISLNDDSNGTLQSTLTPLFVANPGTYYLAISRFSRHSVSAGGRMWQATPYSMERAPDGPGFAGAITHWDATVAGLTGAYIIDLSGVCFIGGGACYANCDGSTTEPVLNVDDFTCFINEFAAAQVLPHEQQVTSYANCDQSTIAPVLNVDDFTCFINQYAAGCP